MKALRISLLCVLFLSIMNTACAQVGKVTVEVTDYETGDPISGVRVSMGFVQYSGMSAGPENESDCVTDSDGRCTMWGHGNGGSATVAVMTTSDYYGATETIEFFRNGSGPIAKPWNPTIQLRLKKKKNPIPMYAMKLSDKRVPEEFRVEVVDKKTGKFNEGPAETFTVAWDLEKGDWVKPYGKGETVDFIFTIRRKERRTYIYDSLIENRIFDYDRNTKENIYLACGATVEIKVSNDGDGFIPYPVPKEKRNGGPWLPYLAPEDGYRPWVPRHERGKGIQPADMNYFFRVRTIKDATGKIISANYGKIYGDFRCDSVGNDISFTYYFNPTPNDRNVEFKLGSNLFTNLHGSQDPFDP